MTWARLVLDYCRVLVWPLVIVWTVWFFRVDIRQLLGRVKGVSAMGVRLDLETEKLARDGVALQQLLPTGPGTSAAPAAPAAPAPPVAQEPEPEPAPMPSPSPAPRKGRARPRSDPHSAGAEVLPPAPSASGSSASSVIDQWVASEDLAVDAYSRLVPGADIGIGRPARLAGLVGAVAGMLGPHDHSFDPLVRYAERLELAYRDLLDQPDAITPDAALNFRASCEAFRAALQELAHAVETSGVAGPGNP